MAGTTSTEPGSFSDKAADFRDTAVSAAKELGDSAAASTQDYRDTASASLQDAKAKASGIAHDVKTGAKSAVDELKDRASDHVHEAKDLVSSLASEARAKIADVVDQQKNAGADQLASFSRAAQNAAGDLDEQNPQVARLVRDAASTVDRFAGDLRDRNLSDVVASVSEFARSQPVAFFAGSVLAGFVLARFLKSEPSQRSQGYDRGYRV